MPIYKFPLPATALPAVHEQKNLNSPLTSAEDQGIKGGARVEDAGDGGREGRKDFCGNSFPQRRKSSAINAL